MTKQEAFESLANCICALDLARVKIRRLEREIEALKIENEEKNFLQYGKFDEVEE
jgi:cob(I)alamin adenosyltransferase